MLTLTNPENTASQSLSRDRFAGEGMTGPAMIEFFDEPPLPPFQFRLDGGSSSDNGCMQVELPAGEWPATLERQFQSLAKKVALETATADEETLFKALTHQRRTFGHPRSGEEVLWEMRQREVVNNLLSALQMYVRFQRLQDNPWSRAKENLHK
jgi:hypothetical protein